MTQGTGMTMGDRIVQYTEGVTIRGHKEEQMAPIRILVVDDDSIIRDLIVTFLEFKGFVVKAAHNGEEAIQILEKENFHVVITDLIMGEINGHDVVRYARDLDPETVLIIITGNCQAETRDKSINNGADAFFCKPFSLEELLNSLPSPILPSKVL